MQKMLPGARLASEGAAGQAKIAVSMGHLGEVELGASFTPFEVLREHYGFVPNVFRAQVRLPRLIEAEAAMVASLLDSERALSRTRKERILLAVAGASRNPYCTTLHYQNLFALGTPARELDQIVDDYRQARLDPADAALLDFAVRLATSGPSILRQDIEELRSHAWAEEAVFETVLTTAWARFFCTLAAGVNAAPDFDPVPLRAPDTQVASHARNAEDGSGPYLRLSGVTPDDFPPVWSLNEAFGFVPNLCRAQAARPDIVEAEVNLLRTVLLTTDVLTRLQKEYILLVVSARNRNTYAITVHSEILRRMDVSPDHSDQVAFDHRKALLSGADKALLDFALKLAAFPTGFSEEEVSGLRTHGYSDEQVLEAVAMTALTGFLNTVQAGLGVEPDFPPRHALREASPKTVHLPEQDLRPTLGSLQADPDAELVARVQSGDVDAFEDLMNRSSRRVFRTLVGILGNPEEARDAMQDTFLKAFQHLSEFQGRSKFSTWLVSIASNTGLQLLRERKQLRSLDDEGFESDEGFRVREVRAWVDDPEQAYSKAETRSLVERTVMRLPAKYRVVLMLRDLEQLSIDESASALGLGVAALKARLLRGRLMVREALSPHFAGRAKGGAV